LRLYGVYEYMKNGRLMKRIFIIIYVLLLSFTVLHSQEPGKIIGMAVDKRNKALLEHVTIVIEQTRDSTKTDKSGEFTFDNVPPGTYTLIAWDSGYVQEKIKGIRVYSAKTTFVSFSLNSEKEEDFMFKIRERMRLMEKVPAGFIDSTLYYEGFSGGISLEKDKMVDLPLRNVRKMLHILPGISPVGREGEFSVRGGTLYNAGFFIDGFPVQNIFSGGSTFMLNPESLDRITVNTGSVSAEYGGFNSGMVNYVTATGSDSISAGLHGVSDFLLQESFNPSGYGYNVYSATVSGPFFHFPHVHYFITAEKQFLADRTPSPYTSRHYDLGRLPGNDHHNFKWFGKFYGKISPGVEIITGIFRNNREWNTYDITRKDNPEHFLHNELSNTLYYGKINMITEKNDRISLGVSWTEEDLRNGDRKYWDNFENYKRQRIRYDETKLFYNMQPDERNYETMAPVNWMHTNTSSFFLRGKYGGVFRKIHNVMAGFSYRKHTVRYFYVGSLVNYEEQSERDQYFVNYGYDSDNGKEEVNTGKYEPRYPKTFSLFLEDNFRKDKYSCTIGLRYELFDSGSHRVTKIDRPPDSQRWVLIEGDTKKHHTLSPRIVLGAYDTENTFLYVGFNMFYQMPPAQLFLIPYSHLESTLNSYNLPNPELKPEQVNLYEFGVRHGFNEEITGRATVYYKNFQNLVTYEGAKYLGNMENYSPSFSDKNDGVCKGLEGIVSWEYSENSKIDFYLSLNTSYGNGFGYNSSKDKLEYVYFEKLDYMRRINFVVNYALRIPESGERFTGNPFLRNCGLNLLFHYRSGLPYTPVSKSYNELSLRAGSPEFSDRLNSKTMPGFLECNLKAYKTVGFSSGVNLKFYLWVVNLFNNKNPLSVFRTTGDPYDSEWLGTEEGKEWLAEYGEGGKENYYDRVYDPLRFHRPRMFKVGAELFF